MSDTTITENTITEHTLDAAATAMFQMQRWLQTLPEEARQQVIGSGYPLKALDDCLTAYSALADQGELYPLSLRQPGEMLEAVLRTTPAKGSA